MATKNMHFKEVSPQKTIDKIRNILRNIIAKPVFVIWKKIEYLMLK